MWERNDDGTGERGSLARSAHDIRVEVGGRMKWKWLLLLGIALIAVAAAALGLLDKKWTDFAWGLAAGTGIGTAVGWFTERDPTK